MVVVFDNVPLLPVMITIPVPVAVAAALKVTVLEFPATVENEAVTPVGKPLALRVTAPVKPPVGAIVMMLVAELPCVTATVAGFADKVKFGFDTIVVTAS